MQFLLLDDSCCQCSLIWDIEARFSEFLETSNFMLRVKPWLDEFPEFLTKTGERGWLELIPLKSGVFILKEKSYNFCQIVILGIDLILASMINIVRFSKRRAKNMSNDCTAVIFTNSLFFWEIKDLKGHSLLFLLWAFYF